MKQSSIYCRFSPRHDAKECDSNEKQELRCVAYCNQKGYIVNDARYWDDAISGSILLRPGLSSALKALTPGMILVVDTPDRLARDLFVDLTIRKQILELGCTLEFADGSPSTETPEGELMHDIMAAFASYERKRYARRTKAGMAKKKAAGVWCGRPPIGWRKVKGEGKLIEDKNEQSAIREMTAGAESEFSSEVITAILNRTHGLCRGHRWSARTVRKILARPADFNP